MMDYLFFFFKNFIFQTSKGWTDYGKGMNKIAKPSTCDIEPIRDETYRVPFFTLHNDFNWKK